VAYCIADEIQDAGTQLGNYPAWFLDDCIERASRYFDHLCGVVDGFFEPAGETATSKVIYGDGSVYLNLPPYVAGSLNTTLTVPSGYILPSFIERDGFLVITGLTGTLLTRAALGHASDSVWWDGVPITVSARWGYAATPADVKMAVIEMVINLLRTVDPAVTNLTDLEGQPLREKVPPRVAEVAKYYRAQGAVLV
jgi:hypothetical protein